MPCVSQKHLNLVQPCLQLAHIVLVECYLALYVAFAALSPKHLEERSSAELRKIGCGFGHSMFG